MTHIEDRVRSGLHAEAQALSTIQKTARSSVPKATLAWSGAGIAVGMAAVVLVVFGGVSLLTGGNDGGGAADQPAVAPTSAAPANTSIPSINPDGVELVPFSGETWQLTVTEDSNPDGTYDVCFVVNPISRGADSAGASPWCDTWPKSDPRITRDLLGVHHLLVTDESYVMVVQLNNEPVDQIAVTGDGVDESVTPFTLPDSGAQLAAVEVPQTNGTITVTALDQTGVVVDEQEGMLGRIEPLVIEGTPINDTTVDTIGSMMAGEPISDEELAEITGSMGFTHSGYLIESTITSDGVYELGLIVYQEEPMAPGGQPVICFSEYSMTQGVNVAGGAACASSQEKAEELASFGLGAGGSCGPHPKEEPIVDGNWLTLAIWGIPEPAESVIVGLGDGTIVRLDVGNGVALHTWEGQTDITSIRFDGISQAQQGMVSSYLPIQGISDDCNGSDGAG